MTSIPITGNGVIIARFGNRADVETSEGDIIRCHIRQQLSHSVCGDRVRYETSQKDAHMIVAIEPRTSELGRVDDRNRIKPLAANVTDIFIVLAFRPIPSLLLLDSYLVAAELLKLRAHIIFNKSELPNKKERQELETQLAIYENLEYPVMWLSCENKTGIKELEKEMKGKISVFVGQSGVGKSSIVSRLLPEIDIAVGALSPGIEAGAHTTTTTRLYHLPRGGDVIDSPGIREFGLWHLTKEQIMQGFREIALLAADCKFRNCTHIHEPHCKVREMHAEGKLAHSRYQNYCRLYAGERN